jgi:hypothetical protein
MPGVNPNVQITHSDRGISLNVKVGPANLFEISKLKLKEIGNNNRVKAGLPKDFIAKSFLLLFDDDIKISSNFNRNPVVDRWKTVIHSFLNEVTEVERLTPMEESNTETSSPNEDGPRRTDNSKDILFRPIGQTVKLSTELTRRAQEARLLHNLLGHPSDSNLARAFRGGVLTGTPLTSNDIANAKNVLGPCLSCLKGKTTAPSYKTSNTEPATKVGEFGQIDIYPFTQLTVGGIKYLLFYVDEFSGYIIGIGMKSKSKSEIILALTALLSKLAQYGHKMTVLKADHESNIASCQVFLNQQGIVFKQMPPYQHIQRLERYVRTVNDRFRTILASLPYILPKNLYGELAGACIDNVNIVPNILHPTQTPSILFCGTKLDVSMLPNIPFGQPAMFACPKANPTDKMAPRSEFGISLGRHPTSPNSIRVYFIPSGRISVRKHFTLIPGFPHGTQWPVHNYNSAQQDNNSANRIKESVDNKGLYDILNDEPIDSMRTQSTPSGPTTLPSRDIQYRKTDTISTVPDLQLAHIRDLPQPEELLDHTEEAIISKDGPTISSPKIPANGQITTMELERTVSIDTKSVQENNPTGIEVQGHSSMEHPLNVTSQGTTRFPAVAGPSDPYRRTYKPSRTRTNITSNVDLLAINQTLCSSTENSRKRLIALQPMNSNPNIRAKTSSQQIEERDTLRADVISYMTLLVGEELAYRTSVNEALKGPKSTEALKAIKGEIRNMIEYQVGRCKHMHELHTNVYRDILPSFMFLIDKYLPNGDYDKMKARLVGGGHRQNPWQYDDISSTTVNITSIFTLLNISSLTRGHLCTFDIKGAFLNAPFKKGDTPIYIRIDKELAALWIIEDPSAKPFLTSKGGINT